MTRYAILSFGLAFVLLTGIAADRPAPAPAAGASIKDLTKARVDLIEAALRLMKKQYEAGLGPSADMSIWLRRRAEARLESAENKDQRIAILTEWVAGMKEEESRIEKSLAAGILSPGTQQLDLFSAKYIRLEAELRLAKVNAE